MGPHARQLSGTQLPSATISVPPFPGTEPVSPTSSAAGCRGSGRHRGHRWGHHAHCRQGTACLTTGSPYTAPAQVPGEPGHGARKGGEGRTGHEGAANPGTPAQGWQAGAREPPANRLHCRASAAGNPPGTLSLHSGVGAALAVGLLLREPLESQGKDPRRRGGAAPGHRWPWVDEQALLPRGNSTNHAACCVLCYAPVWSPSQTVVQSRASQRGTREPGWELQPCHTNQAPSSEGACMHFWLPKEELQSQALLQNISILRS